MAAPLVALVEQSRQHDSRVLKALYPLAVIGGVYEGIWGTQQTGFSGLGKHSF